MNPSSPVINIPSTARSNPEGYDSEWEPRNSTGGDNNSAALENSLNREWRGLGGGLLGADGIDSLKPSRSISMPAPEGFRAMSLQEPRTLWGYAQTLRQEVHYDGRLERRVDSNGYTSWEPCWCELNDGEFKYAPVVGDPQERGGQSHASSGGGSGGNGSSSNARDGGLPHSQGRSGGTFRNSGNNRSGSGERSDLGSSSSSSCSGGGGGSVPLESAVAVRTVRGAPHSFTVVVADGSGLVFRASDRATYQEWLFHFHSSILAIAERIRDRYRTHRSLLSREPIGGGSGAPRVSGFASGSVSTASGGGLVNSGPGSSGVGAAAAPPAAGGGDGSGIGDMCRYPSSEDLTLRRLPTRDSAEAEQHRALYAVAAAAPASASPSSSPSATNAHTDESASVYPPSLVRITASSPSALASSLSASMPASPSLLARAHASGASPLSQLQRPLDAPLGRNNANDYEYFGELNDGPGAPSPLPQSHYQQPQEQQRPISSSLGASYLLGSSPPKLPPSPPTLPFLPSSAALSSSLGLGHGHLYYGGRRRAMSQRENSDRDSNSAQSFSSSSATKTGSPGHSGLRTGSGVSSGLSSSLASGLLAHRSSSRSSARDGTLGDDFAPLSGLSLALTPPSSSTGSVPGRSSSSSSSSGGIGSSLEGQSMRRTPTVVAPMPAAAASTADVSRGGMASSLEGQPLRRPSSPSPTQPPSPPPGNAYDLSGSSSSSSIITGMVSGSPSSSVGGGVDSIVCSRTAETRSSLNQGDAATAVPSPATDPTTAAETSATTPGADVNSNAESSRQRPLLVDFRSGFSGFRKQRDEGGHENGVEEDFGSSSSSSSRNQPNPSSNHSSPERGDSEDSNSGSSALDAAVLEGLSGGLRGPGAGCGIFDFTASSSSSSSGGLAAESAAAADASKVEDTNEAAAVAMAVGSAGDSVEPQRANPSSSSASSSRSSRNKGGALRWRSGAFCAKGARAKNEDTYYLCDNWAAGGITSCKSRPTDSSNSAAPPSSSSSSPFTNAANAEPPSGTSATAAAAAEAAAAKRAQGSFTESRDAQSGAFVSSRARGGGGGGLRHSPPRQRTRALNGATNANSATVPGPQPPPLFPPRSDGGGGDNDDRDKEDEGEEGFWAFYGVYDGHCGAEAAEVAATGLHHDVFAPPLPHTVTSTTSSTGPSMHTAAATAVNSTGTATSTQASPTAAAAAAPTERGKGSPASWAKALDGEAGAAEAVFGAAFLAMDTRYLELARAEGHYSGTTAVCALVCNKGTSLVVANLGDSAAVLLRRQPSSSPTTGSNSTFSASSSDSTSSCTSRAIDPTPGSTASTAESSGPSNSSSSSGSSDSSRSRNRSFAYEAVKLTEAHKPGAPAEQARVEAAGGWITEERELFMGQLHRMDLDDPEIVSKAEAVVQWQTINRVCGDLAVSRSLGDPDFKGFSPDSHAQPPDDFIFAFPPDHPRSFSADLVLATPDTTRHDLRAGDEYLVLASDGLWDVLNGQEVADAVAAFSQRAAHRANIAAGEEGREGMISSSSGGGGGGGSNNDHEGNGNGNGNGHDVDDRETGSHDQNANASEQGESELETLAEELVRLALRLGSADNITVAIIRFEYE